MPGLLSCPSEFCSFEPPRRDRQPSRPTHRPHRKKSQTKSPNKELTDGSTTMIVTLTAPHSPSLPSKALSKSTQSTFCRPDPASPKLPSAREPTVFTAGRHSRVAARVIPKGEGIEAEGGMHWPLPRLIELTLTLYNFVCSPTFKYDPRTTLIGSTLTTPQR